MIFTDTHCHIHSLDYPLDADDVLSDAIKDEVENLICVGTDLDDSKLAIEFVLNRDHTWASIGLHPHEVKHYQDNKESLQTFSDLASKNKVVAVGECGLDYYYDHSTKSEQREILEFQINLALESNLPLIFHVREAFDDFFAVLDNFKGVRGVVHSFTANIEVLNEALKRDLYIGLNGIMTFSKDEDQLAAASKVPKYKLLLETDSPYLTPTPLRGTICQPKYVKLTAEFLAKLRNCTTAEIAEDTTSNAKKLFKLTRE